MSTFSLRTFLERVSNNFVDPVFRGHHHLSIPPLALCPILCRFQPQHITDFYKGNNLAQGLPCGSPGEATHMDSRLSVTPATAGVLNYLQDVVVALELTPGEPEEVSQDCCFCHLRATRWTSMNGVAFPITSKL